MHPWLKILKLYGLVWWRVKPIGTKIKKPFPLLRGREIVKVFLGVYRGSDNSYNIGCLSLEHEVYASSDGGADKSPATADDAV